MPESATAAPPCLHLRSAEVSVLLDCEGQGLPRVVHWGADLGPLPDEALTGLVAASRPQTASSSPWGVSKLTRRSRTRRRGGALI